MTSFCRLAAVVFSLAYTLGSWSQLALANEPSPPPGSKPQVSAADHKSLVEEFTALNLAVYEIKLGTDMEVGLLPELMIGVDLVAAAVGAATFTAKYQFFADHEHQLALTLRAAYLNRKTLLWGSANDHFDELDARILRPGLAWSNVLSPRLRLHTFWAKGFGTVTARLSEKGQRQLWEAKHPGDDYEKRNRRTKQPTTTTEDSATEAVNSTENQEKDANAESSLTSQSLQVQSITGLAQERFQLTGEFVRKNGNKVLVTSRIEQSQFESLKSNSFRLTAAHQWVWSGFQMRLGIGTQYYVMSGRDLDGELIDSAGVQPVSDIAFYWRF